MTSDHVPEEAASYQHAMRKVERTDNQLRIWQTLVSVIAALVVIAGVLVVGERQVEYHQQQVHTNNLVLCETKALDQILTELATAAAHPHSTPPKFVYPNTC